MAGIKIAQIDDEDHFHRLLKRFLRKKEGIDLKSYSRSEHFIDELVAGYAPDLVISDTDLKLDREGYVFAEEMRKGYPNLHIVGTSSNPEYEPEWLNRGFHFLHKDKLYGFNKFDSTLSDLMKHFNL